MVYIYIYIYIFAHINSELLISEVRTMVAFNTALTRERISRQVDERRIWTRLVHKDEYMSRHRYRCNFQATFCIHVTSFGKKDDPFDGSWPV